MKRFLRILTLVLLCCAPVARADGPDEQYIPIYGLVQQGDALMEKGQLSEAMAKYVEAESQLKKFKIAYSDWNPTVVKYRLDYLTSRISELSARNGSAPATAAPNTPATAPAGVATPAVPAAIPADPIKELQDQIRHLEAERVLLQAKLKEALAAQPAATDPREYAKAMEQIKDLTRRNELLAASLAEAKGMPAPATIAQPGNSATFAPWIKPGPPTNSPAAKPGKTNQPAPLMADTADAKIAMLTATNTALLMEKKALQERIKMLSTGTPGVTPDTALAGLRAENETLKAQLASLKPGTTPSVSMMDSVSADRIRQLQAQRDEMQKSLEKATEDIYGKKKGKTMATRMDEMTRQLAGLRARLEALDLHPIPYTTEELAVISHGTQSLQPPPPKKQLKELPAANQLLLKEARNFVISHKLPEAEAKYQELLKLDPKSVPTLDDLASIQMDIGRTNEAEKNLKASMALEPENDYTFYIKGKLMAVEGRVDDALEAFGHAAQLNNQDAEIQRYLGITLAEKGLRVPAETALRRAVELAPEYGEAQFSLAGIYATAKPPMTELARWHYQKSLTCQNPHPKDARMEALLEAGSKTSVLDAPPAGGKP